MEAISTTIAPGTTSAADKAAADAALRNLDTAFIGLYNLFS
jgi:hypothetical protein